METNNNIHYNPVHKNLSRNKFVNCNLNNNQINDLIEYKHQNVIECINNTKNKIDILLNSDLWPGAKKKE